MDVTKVQNEMINKQCMEWIAMFQGKDSIINIFLPV